MAEWSNAAVLKTVEVQASGGSNPSFSAIFFKVLLKGWAGACVPYGDNDTRFIRDFTNTPDVPPSGLAA